MFGNTTAPNLVEILKTLKELLTYVWLWPLSRWMSPSRVKAMVTGFFGVLSHVRNEYRKFRDDQR